jgi:hypothetical protein
MQVPTVNDFLQGFDHLPVPTVSDPPTYASLTATRNALCCIAAQTPTTRGGGASGYVGIVLPGPLYNLEVPGTPFLLPVNPGALPAIPTDANIAVISATERLHEESLRQWQEYSNLHAALKVKLEASVNPIYLQSICHRYKRFAQTTLLEIFQHLFDTYAPLDEAQVKANRLRLHDPWDPSGRLEDLICHLKDVQDMATEANLASDANRPILDMDLIAAAFSTIFSCGLYDFECKTWEARPAVECTWPNFKNHFLLAQTTLHRRNARRLLAKQTRQQYHTIQYNTIQ